MSDAGIVLLHACKKQKEGAQRGDVELAYKPDEGNIEMNKKHIGGSFFDDVKKWEKEDTDFRVRVNEHIEKRMLAVMLKEIREKEHISQTELAKKAGVPLSVIARIEGGTAKALPRFNLFNRILSAAGYKMLIQATKGGKRVQVAFSD